jgi:hypothetical protein
LGELKISEARYEDLLGEADERYSRYLSLALRSFLHERRPIVIDLACNN